MSQDTAAPERRSALLRAHYAVENRHDIDGIMATFAPGAVMTYNHMPFSDPDSIRQAHGTIGFFGDSGGFDGLQTFAEHEHLTADEIVVEGRVRGRHVNEFLGFAPTGRDVELPFVGIYRFDATGKLVSERIVMNLGPLAP